jgi:hypothetical protein
VSFSNIIVKPFAFKGKTKQEVVDQLDQEFPITLKYNVELVDRVYARYPLIEKHQVGFIIKAVFVSFRELLILGKILNFYGLFYNARIFFTSELGADKIIRPRVKIKVATPPHRKKAD